MPPGATSKYMIILHQKCTATKDDQITKRTAPITSSIRSEHEKVRTDLKSFSNEIYENYIQFALKHVHATIILSIGW